MHGLFAVTNFKCIDGASILLQNLDGEREGKKKGRKDNLVHLKLNWVRIGQVRFGKGAHFAKSLHYLTKE